MCNFRAPGQDPFDTGMFVKGPLIHSIHSPQASKDHYSHPPIHSLVLCHCFSPVLQLLPTIHYSVRCSLFALGARTRLALIITQWPTAPWLPHSPVTSLDASEFTPSKGQRRTVARINRFIKNQYVPLKISRESIAREDTCPPEEHSPSPEPSHNPTHGARRKSISPPLGRNETSHADFIQNIHAADMDKADPGSDWRQFKVG